jgi:6-phosphogluconolactonase
MFTRRRFLVLFPAFAATAHSFASLPTLRKKKVPPPPPVFIYFGADTSKGVSKGIYQSRFDQVTGQLTQPVLAAATARPSFMALSPARNGQKRFLYAVNAVNDPAATVTTFEQHPDTGALNQIGQVTSGGAGPAYISVDATGHSAFVANYFGSTVASYRVQPDGTLSQPVSHIDFKDRKFGSRGPNTVRQDIPHPHCATISPDDRFLLVCDLGSDAISVFVIDNETGHLTISDPHLFDVRPGSGPRHVVFHPNGRWIYSVNELDSTVDHLLWTKTSSEDNPQGFVVNANFHIKTIADDFPAEKNTAAEVAVSPDGLFLYASNRGEDTLVVFSIRPKDGHLTLVQRISCGGKTPRHFTFDPTGRWLICGNQDSATVTIFRRDAGTGKLGGPIQTLTLDSPLYSLFA